MVCGLLIAVASLVAEQGLWGTWASVVGVQVGAVVMVLGLSCPATCGNLPRPGIEPMFPALAGRFLTAGHPGNT